MKLIQSEGEFLTTLNEGDQFWTISTLFKEPIGIAGPYRITKFLSSEMGHVLVQCEGSLSKHFITDLTNSWHGVLLSAGDAEAYFLERRRAYESDPALMAETERERKMVGLMDHLDNFGLAEEEDTLKDLRDLLFGDMW
jgi:hypothetical protein